MLLRNVEILKYKEYLQKVIHNIEESQVQNISEYLVTATKNILLQLTLELYATILDPTLYWILLDCFLILWKPLARKRIIQIGHSYQDTLILSLGNMLVVLNFNWKKKKKKNLSKAWNT